MPFSNISYGRERLAIFPFSKETTCAFTNFLPDAVNIVVLITQTVMFFNAARIVLNRFDQIETNK